MQAVRDRYKHLVTEVEQAFYSCKDSHLATLAFCTRTTGYIRSHALVVQVAYLKLEIRRAWGALDLHVEERLLQLCKPSLSTERKEVVACARAHTAPKATCDGMCHET
jgi:hypothetical protein